MPSPDLVTTVLVVQQAMEHGLQAKVPWSTKTSRPVPVSGHEVASSVTHHDVQRCSQRCGRWREVRPATEGALPTCRSDQMGTEPEQARFRFPAPAAVPRRMRAGEGEVDVGLLIVLEEQFRQAVVDGMDACF